MGRLTTTGILDLRLQQPMLVHVFVERGWWSAFLDVRCMAPGGERCNVQLLKIVPLSDLMIYSGLFFEQHPGKTECASATLKCARRGRMTHVDQSADQLLYERVLWIERLFIDRGQKVEYDFPQQTLNIPRRTPPSSCRTD